MEAFTVERQQLENSASKMAHALTRLQDENTSLEDRVLKQSKDISTESVENSRLHQLLSDKDRLLEAQSLSGSYVSELSQELLEVKGKHDLAGQLLR